MSDHNPPRYDPSGQPQRQQPPPMPDRPSNQYTSPHDPQPSPQVSPTSPAPHAQDSIFESLADIRFRKFATPRLLTILYVLTLIGAGLALLAYLGLALASGDAGVIVLMLIFAPLVAFIYIIYARLMLEVIAVIHRQRELLQEISNKLSR